MNSWSSKRKGLVTFIIFVFLVFVVGTPIYLHYHQKPTCFDRTMNGDETGIDCGGSCQLMCAPDVLPLLIKGTPRIIEESAKTYVIALQVQNPNTYGEVLHAGYTIKLFDATSSAPFKTLTGSTFVPKNTTFGIFVGPMFIPDETPTRVTFVWDAPLPFLRNTTTVPKVSVTNPLFAQTAKPRLTATLMNSSNVSVSNIEAVAFVEDEQGNFIGASKTFVDVLAPGASSPLVFTWPQNFVGTSTAVEVITRVFPDASYR